jgi:hypothetical protein
MLKHHRLGKGALPSTLVRLMLIYNKVRIQSEDICPDFL